MSTPRIASRTATTLALGLVVCAVGAALVARAGAPGDEAPELDKQRVATCEARGGRLARNHQGQMLCKDAKIKLKDYLEKNPPPAAGPAPTPGPAPKLVPIRAPLAKPPAVAPAPGGTHEVPAGPPQVPPDPPPVTPPHGVQNDPGANKTGPGGGGGQGVPPALQPKPPTTTGAACYLRACLYSSYTKRCDCHEYRSAELCQFKETTAGGTCTNPQGMTTALCPAGTSCVNGRCQAVCN